jgi:hypothetical protein
MRAPPTGTSQRYGLTHFHPGQIRNAYPKHNQADIARCAIVGLSPFVTKPVWRKGARRVSPGDSRLALVGAPGADVIGDVSSRGRLCCSFVAGDAFLIRRALWVQHD